MITLDNKEKASGRISSICSLIYFGSAHWALDLDQAEQGRNVLSSPGGSVLRQGWRYSIGNDIDNHWVTVIEYIEASMRIW